MVLLAGAVASQLILNSMSTAADSPTSAPDTELEAKKREADLAEADARLQTALKNAALAKKDALAATNADLLRAEQDKTKALAEQAAAEAEKAKFNASLPAPATKPLEGKVEADDKAGYFAELLAYESVQENATSIAQAITTKLTKDSKVYLVKQPDYLKGAVQLKEVEDRLAIIDKTLNLLCNYKPVGGAIPEPEIAPLLALAAVPAVLGAVADVAALFRVDRSIKGRQFTVNEEALAVAVTGFLAANNNGIQVIRPQFNADPQSPFGDKLKQTRENIEKAANTLYEIRKVLGQNSNTIESIQSKITTKQSEYDKVATDTSTARAEAREEIKRLKDLFEKVPADDKRDERTRLQKLINDEEAKLRDLDRSKTERLASLKAAIAKFNDDLKGPRDQKVRGDILVSQFEAVLKSASDLTTRLVSVPDGGSVSPLASLAETSILRASGDQDLILTVSVAGQGGEMELRKSIWTSGTVYHRAGSACHYVLFDKRGRVICSGLVVANRQAKEGKPINTLEQSRARPPVDSSKGASLLINTSSAPGHSK
jgi:hypothetical protein